MATIEDPNEEYYRRIFWELWELANRDDGPDTREPPLDPEDVEPGDIAIISDVPCDGRDYYKPIHRPIERKLFGEPTGVFDMHMERETWRPETRLSEDSGIYRRVE